MSVYRISIPPHVADVLAHFPPVIKRDAKQAMRIIAKDPHAGEPLKRELAGLWKYRIRSFRVVYHLVPEDRVVQIMAVDHRDTVYEVVRALWSPRSSEKKEEGRR